MSGGAKRPQRKKEYGCETTYRIRCNHHRM